MEIFGALMWVCARSGINIHIMMVKVGKNSNFFSSSHARFFRQEPNKNRDRGEAKQESRFLVKSIKSDTGESGRQ